MRIMRVSLLGFIIPHSIEGVKQFSRVERISSPRGEKRKLRRRERPQTQKEKENDMKTVLRFFGAILLIVLLVGAVGAILYFTNGGTESFEVFYFRVGFFFRSILLP